MALDDKNVKKHTPEELDENQAPKGDTSAVNDINNDLNIDIGDGSDNKDNKESDGKDLVNNADNLTENAGDAVQSKSPISMVTGQISSFFKSLVPTKGLPKKALVGLVAGSLGLGGIGLSGIFDEDDGHIVLWDNNKPVDTDCMDEFINNASKYLSGQGNDISDAQKMANARLLYSYFKGAYNMSDEKIAAALGNLEQETGSFNPALIEGNDSGRYSVDPMDPVAFSSYSDDHKDGSIYYNVPSNKGGYSSAVGIGVFQFTGEAAVDYLLYCKAHNFKWDDMATQLAYSSMKGGYRTANTWLGGPGTKYTNFFEYFADTDYRSSANAASGRHVGFGNNYFATGISSSGNVSSYATGVTSAFDGQDVEKLTKIFCAGFLGWKPAWDYKKRTDYARKWLAVIKTFQVDRSFSSSVLAMANVSAIKARNSLLDSPDCTVTSTNFDNSSIAMAALSMAYDDRSKAFNQGTPLYRKIFNAILGGGLEPRSCASLVASAVLWSGVDDEYPRSADVQTQASYLFRSATNSGKWKLMNREIISGGGFDDVETIKKFLQPGDLLVWKNGFPTGDGTSSSETVSHICVYTGSELPVKVFGEKARPMDTVEASYSSDVSKRRSAALGNLTSYRTKPGSGSRANFQVYRCIHPQKEVSKYKNIAVEGTYNAKDYAKNDTGKSSAKADEGTTDNGTTDSE